MLTVTGRFCAEEGSKATEHLGKMLGDTIAAVTAFLVVNVAFEPSYVARLAPTVILTPLSAIWMRKLNSGVKRKGIPDTADA